MASSTQDVLTGSEVAQQVEPSDTTPRARAFAKLNEVQGEIQEVQKPASGIFCSAEHTDNAATQRIVQSRTKNGKKPYAFWSLADQHTLVLHHFSCGQIIRAVANSDWSRQKQSPPSPTQEIQWCRVFLKPNGKFLNPEKSQGRVSGFCGCQREGGKLYIDFLQAWIYFPNTYSSRKSKEKREKRETEKFLLEAFPPEDDHNANTFENQIVPKMAAQPSQDLGSFRRLDQFAKMALQHASWHRRSKNYSLANWHLQWVEYYFEQHKREHNGTVPAARLAELHCQSALIRFYPLVRGNPNPTEAMLSQMIDEMNLGIKFASEAKNEDGIEAPCRFWLANCQGLLEIEKVKFLQKQENSKDTFHQAFVTANKLGLAKDELRVSLGHQRKGISSRLTLFTLSRNQYLHLREAIKSEGSSRTKIKELKGDALEVCLQGATHVDRSFECANTNTLPADVVEMRRCLAEAYFVNEQFSDACGVCKVIYDWSLRSPFCDETRLIRVLAIWIASLRSLLAMQPVNAPTDSHEGLSARLKQTILAFFHHYRHGIKIGLAENLDFLTNARFFLSKETSIDERDKGVSDSYFLPKPLLPPEHLREADNILQTIEDRVAARSIQQRN